jgi:GTP-sensing pleiotropic transcriptional regulator CodY
MLNILKDCVDKNFDDTREYRLSGDIKYLQGFAKDMIAAIAAQQTKDQSATLNKFKEELTSKETSALQAIIQDIGAEGNISIVKMIQKTGYSRPVFTNLLAKLELFKVAEVQNQGVKGTYIKFSIPLNDIKADN